MAQVWISQDVSDFEKSRFAQLAVLAGQRSGSMGSQGDSKN